MSSCSSSVDRVKTFIFPILRREKIRVILAEQDNFPAFSELRDRCHLGLRLPTSFATSTKEDNSSGTTTSSATKKEKVDRSRNLISERRRRGWIKDKLYALCSLVPNITKMDKASIIGDVVFCVQDLQMEAKKLEVEIAGLEASMAGSKRYQEGLIGNPFQTRLAGNKHPMYKKILKVDMFQVEDKGFYKRVICNKSRLVALSLYRALESLTSFKVQNYNLATISYCFALTFTLNKWWKKEKKQACYLDNYICY
ncbi:hypothetical protein GQ457_08G027230 [Hibiscus cannabinus]